MIETGKTTEV